MPQGFSPPFRQRPLYVLVSIGPLGFMLNQNALRAGTLTAPSSPSSPPLVPTGIARVRLHQTIASTPLGLAAGSLLLAVMNAGIIALAHQAPQAAAGFKTAQREK